MRPNVCRVVCLFLATALSANLSVAHAASFTAAAVSDAFVATGPSGNLSDNNYGGGGALAVAASSLPQGEFQAVIKFDLAGATAAFNSQFGVGQWSLESVTLQLSSSPHSNPIFNDTAPGLFNVSLMQNSAWVEGTGNASNPANNGLTYNSFQNTFLNPTADQSLGTFSFPGGTSGVNDYPLSLAPNLTAALAAGQNVSLRLFAADNSVSYLFSSRAATPASSQPQLIITAIPEASSLGLFALGLGLLLIRFNWSLLERFRRAVWPPLPRGHR